MGLEVSFNLAPLETCHLVVGCHPAWVCRRGARATGQICVVSVTLVLEFTGLQTIPGNILCRPPAEPRGDSERERGQREAWRQVLEAVAP